MKVHNIQITSENKAEAVEETPIVEAVNTPQPKPQATAHSLHLQQADPCQANKDFALPGIPRFYLQKSHNQKGLNVFR